MAYFSNFRPYVPVAKRRAQATKTITKMMKGGQKPQPVEISGRKIAETFWGNAWCENLERYSDYANRLPRGKTYARNGSVIHLEIKQGKIEAMVQGSELYHVGITIVALEKPLWEKVKQQSTGKITNLLDLIQGKLPKDILLTITAPETGLFPSPKQIKLSCSCPDGASMCKHVAAVLYGVGNRLDKAPELFFTLRSADMQELLASAGTHTADFTGLGSELGADNLSDIFGIEIEGLATVPSTPERPAKPAKSLPAKKSIKTQRKATARKTIPPTAKAVKKATKKAAQKVRRKRAKP